MPGGELVEEDPGDEEPRNDEEHAHAEASGIELIEELRGKWKAASAGEMGEHDERHGHGAQAVERRHP